MGEHMTALRPRLHIAVEGAVGVGKSTVLTTLAARYASQSVVFIPEPVELWRSTGMLQRYYRGTMSALEFQMAALTTLYAPFAQAMSNPAVRVIVTERSMRSNLEVFGRLNLRGEALEDFETVFNALESTLPPRLEVMLYLQATPHRLVERVATRGRPEEADLDEAFQASLVEAHVTMCARHADAIHIDAHQGPAEVADRCSFILETALASCRLIREPSRCERLVECALRCLRMAGCERGKTHKSNASVMRRSRHSTSVDLGLAADSVAQADYDMASATDGMNTSELSTGLAGERRGLEERQPRPKRRCQGGAAPPDYEPNLSEVAVDRGGRVVYARLDHESTYEQLTMLCERLDEVAPTVKQLERVIVKSELINQGRVLVEIEDDITLELFGNWLKAALQFNGALVELLASLGSAEARLLGAQWIVPRETADQPEVKRQAAHTDVAAKGEVIAIAVNTRGMSMGTLIDPTARLLKGDVMGGSGFSRADASVFAFDTGVVHAGPGKPRTMGPYPRYYVDRVFFLLCSDRLPKNQVIRHRMDNGFQPFKRVERFMPVPRELPQSVGLEGDIVQIDPPPSKNDPGNIARPPTPIVEPDAIASWETEVAPTGPPLTDPRTIAMTTPEGWLRAARAGQPLPPLATPHWRGGPYPDAPPSPPAMDITERHVERRPGRPRGGSWRQWLTMLLATLPVGRAQDTLRPQGASDGFLAQEVIELPGFTPAWAVARATATNQRATEGESFKGGGASGFVPAWARAQNNNPPKPQATMAEKRQEPPKSFVPVWARAATAPLHGPQRTQPKGRQPRPGSMLQPKNKIEQGPLTHPYAKPAFGASRLRTDQVAHAKALAARLANDRSPGRIDAPLAKLEDMALAVAEARVDGVNPRTASKDAFALREFEAYAEEAGFDPNLRSEWTQRFSERESLKLASWLLWRAQRAVPRSRKGAAVAKPMSIHQNYLALRRVFRLRNVELPLPGVVRETLRGLIRRFIRRYGIEALRPKRVEPVTPAIVKKVLDLAQADTHVIHGVRWSLECHTCFIVMAWMVINRSVGSRKGESTKLCGDVDENDWFARASVAAELDGKIHVEPEPLVLKRMVPGRDRMTLAPRGSKCGQFD